MLARPNAHTLGLEGIPMTQLARLKTRVRGGGGLGFGRDCTAQKSGGCGVGGLGGRGGAPSPICNHNVRTMGLEGVHIML